MVSNDRRNNIIIAALVIAVAIVSVYFMISFKNELIHTGQTITDTANTSQETINVGVLNVTREFQKLVDLKEEEINATKHLEETISNQFKNITENQTNIFVETFEETQNLTKLSQQLTQERIDQEKEIAAKIDMLINASFTPNTTKLE